MNALRCFAVLLACCAIAAAAVPQLINYQGRVAVRSTNTNFNGTGNFKFALINGASGATLWSNNGSSVAGSEPTAAVSLDVSNGLYSVQLGDATLANMSAIPPSVFSNPDVRLRVWFSETSSNFQRLDPDQRVTSVGYAMQAETVKDGAITRSKIAEAAVGSAQIAGGAVGAAQIADGSVRSAELAAGAVTHDKIASTPYLSVDEIGQLHVKALSVDELGGQLSTFTLEGVNGTTSATGVTLVTAPELANGTTDTSTGTDKFKTFTPGARTVTTGTVRRPLTNDLAWRIWVNQIVEQDGTDYHRVVRLELGGGITVSLLECFPTEYRIEQGPNGTFYETLSFKADRYEGF